MHNERQPREQLEKCNNERQPREQIRKMQQ